MQFTGLVTGVDKRHGVKNGKEWDMTTVTVVDMSKEGRCATPLEFTLSREDADLADKLDGETFVFELKKLGVYQGRLDPQVRIAREKPANKVPNGQPPTK